MLKFKIKKLNEEEIISRRKYHGICFTIASSNVYRLEYNIKSGLYKPFKINDLGTYNFLLTSSETAGYSEEEITSKLLREIWKIKTISNEI